MTTVESPGLRQLWIVCCGIQNDPSQIQTGSPLRVWKYLALLLGVLSHSSSKHSHSSTISQGPDLDQSCKVVSEMLSLQFPRCQSSFLGWLSLQSPQIFAFIWFHNFSQVLETQGACVKVSCITADLCTRFPTGFHSAFEYCHPGWTLQAPSYDHFSL